MVCASPSGPSTWCGANDAVEPPSDRLLGDTTREATAPEVKATAYKYAVAGL